MMPYALQRRFIASFDTLIWAASEYTDGMKLQTLIVAASALSVIALSHASSMSTSEPEFNWSDSVIETEEEGKAVLIIPMEGQMHTDVNNAVYSDLVDRIKEAKPDLIVVEILNHDYQNEFAQLMGWGDREEFNGYDKDDLVNIARTFHVDLKDIPQIAWVKNASGTSTIMALSWCDIYMSPDGWLHATTQVARMFDYINAEDTRGKIREAAVAHAKAFATFGCKDQALVRAFVDPEVPLSGTWEGKKVNWVDTLNGDFIVDAGQGMPHLDATTATELAISKGLVYNLKDLLVAEGIREYHIVGEDITNEIYGHKEKWRNDFDRASSLFLDAQQYGNWATGENTARYLREQVKKLKQVLRLMENSSAVAMRMGWKYRVNVKALEQMIEQIEEQLKRLREGDSGRRPSGGGGRPIGGGGGGGR